MAATEALWAQLAGVSYSATEDRRVIAALATPGVVTGFVITAATGRNITVSAGTAIVDDDGEGCYVGYTTAPTPLTVATGATETVYVVVAADTSLVTVVSSTTEPTNPHVAIGSAKANTAGTGLDTTYGTSGISMVNRLQAYPPAMKGVNGQSLYLPLTGGGVVTGAVQADRLLVAGKFGVGGTQDPVPNAPLGVRLGGANPTARHYLHVSAKTPSGSLNVINNATWEGIHWNAPSTSNNITDYTQVPMGATDYAIWPGVAGYYVFAGQVNFANRAGGTRQARISVWNRNGTSADTVSYAINTAETSPTTGETSMSLSGMAALGDPANQYARIELYQNSGSALTATSGRLLFRLLQAN